MDRIGKWYQIPGEQDSYLYVYSIHKDDWLTITFNFDNGVLYTRDMWTENMINDKFVKETNMSKKEIFDMIFLNKWKVDKEYG